MWPALIGAGASIAAGVLGTTGQIQTNRANREMAREQMRFQERMSNTSAQRAVADYRAAGLNPALAYDRGASSPGGASAVMGNATEAGVSSARATAAAVQDMRMRAEAHRENVSLTRAQAEKTRIEAKESEGRQRLQDQEWVARVRDNQYQTIAQPYQLRLQAAQALINELSIPGLRNTANMEDRLGRLAPGMGSSAIRAAAEAFKIFRR